MGIIFRRYFSRALCSNGKKHMEEFGTTEEMMASVAVKNHKHGAKNKYAQYQKEITIEQVMNSK